MTVVKEELNIAFAHVKKYIYLQYYLVIITFVTFER